METVKNAPSTRTPGTLRLQDRALIVLVGLLFAAGGMAFGIKPYHMLSVGAVSTEALVVDSVTVQPNPQSDIFFSPVYSFETEDGATHTAQSWLYSNATPIVGSKEAILYDPNDPERVVGNSFIELWFFPSAGLAVGLMIVLVGLFARSPRKTGAAK